MKRMASCEDQVYVVYDRLTSFKKRLMDPSEGRPYIEPSDPQELPPLYESVNSKDTEDKSSFCLQINRSLLPFKAFFYLFYGAIGSLFPFLALYYKHLWLSAGQAGLLVGLRPMVQSVTVPFWALFADRFNAKKIVLFIGLCGWLFTHISILLVPSGKKPLSCNEDSTHVRKRYSEFSLPNDNAMKEHNRNPRDIIGYNHAVNTKLLNQLNSNNQARFSRQPFEHSDTEDFPKSLGNSLNVSSDIELKTANQSNISELVNSNITAMINDNGKDSWWTMSSNRGPLDTWRTFLYIFLITLIGNMFSAPAQTMANMATLEALNGETHKYGAERCFGSIGWGVSAFVVGMLVSLNHDSSLACKGLDDINYSPCFYAFGAMMLFSLVVAMFFKFRSTNDAYHRKNPASLIQVCKQLDCLTLFVFFTTFLAGFNMGFIQTFLFWHLQNLGGSQRLFSLITAFNAVGEMIGFLLSVKLISKYGHLKVLALGIFAYAVRLTVYGVIKKPWYVLIVEILKAFTSSAVWASVMSYIGADGEFGATVLGIVHMLYWGVGYGGGGWLGGVLMEAVGARMTFLGLAVISLTVVILILVLIHLDCCPKKKQDIYMPLEREDEDEDVEQDSE